MSELDSEQRSSIERTCFVRQVNVGENTFVIDQNNTIKQKRQVAAIRKMNHQIKTASKDDEEIGLLLSDCKRSSITPGDYVVIQVK